MMGFVKPKAQVQFCRTRTFVPLILRWLVQVIQRLGRESPGERPPQLEQAVRVVDIVKDHPIIGLFEVLLLGFILAYRFAGSLLGGLRFVNGCRVVRAYHPETEEERKDGKQLEETLFHD